MKRSIAITCYWGNQAGGGNKYMLVGMDVKTKRLLVTFSTHKDSEELLPALKKMKRHAEMLAKESVEYDGKHKI